MLVFVKTITGRTVALEVDSKEPVIDKEDFLPQYVSLVYRGMHLEDGRTLADYSIRQRRR
jgi:hypothetical protein